MNKLEKYTGVHITKPAGILNQEIYIDFKNFFPKLGKLLSYLLINGFEKFDQCFADTFDFKLEDDVSSLAWILIYTSLVSAVEDLLIDGKSLFNLEHQLDEQKKQDLASILENTLIECEVIIDETFFEQPQNLHFLYTVQERLTPWLIALDIEPLTAQVLVKKLPNKFVLALQLEWQRQPEEYEPIEKAVITPFAKYSSPKQGFYMQTKNIDKNNSGLLKQEENTDVNYTPPKVFISYSHDSQVHKDFILSLANKLREDHIDCTIDQYLNGAPTEGWQLWMEKQIEQADFVLIVCTANYLKRFRREVEGSGRGVAFEGVIITQILYDNYYYNTKFLPLIPENGNSDIHVPLPLKSGTTYRLFNDYEALYRVLTKQPEIVKPPLGTRKKLPSRTLS